MCHEPIAQTLHGKVETKKGEPVSFANVYIKGTTNGTTTNEDGFYHITIHSFPATVVFKHLGYGTVGIQMEPFSGSDSLNITLSPENYTISEVVISANDEDPAYGIMRKAIAKRKFYKQELKEYACDVYIKGVQKITEYPEKILWIEVDMSELTENESGIIYLSESVSRYNFKSPDKIYEEMISSKVSGSNKAFSFNQASGMDLNFYEKLIDFGDLSPRGFVSPLSPSAFFYYRFRLDATYIENGMTVNKIKVIPKRKHDPVFKGYIFIQDSTWRIHGVQLVITKDSQIEIIDSLYMSQVYIPVDSDGTIWQRGSVTYQFGFSFMGFVGGGNYIAVYSNYDVTPAFPKKHFKGEVMKVKKESNKKDITYWEDIRPMPLTKVEAIDYQIKDSLRVMKESEPYLDSIDNISNKFSPLSILTGYSYHNRYRKVRYSFSSVLNSIQFNTVEGWNAGLRISRRKKLEARKEYSIYLDGRYGFSNERLSAVGVIDYKLNPKKFANIGIDGGSTLVQYNDAKPITPIVNTGYSLLAKKNYMKLYLKEYMSVYAGMEITNGITGNVKFTYANREPVKNTTTYSFADNTSRDYTSNIPVNENTNETSFSKNTSFITELNFKFIPGQKYISRPDIKYTLGSKYPELGLKSLTALNGFLNTDAEFFFLSGYIRDDIDVGLLGNFSYKIEGGGFVNSSPDYFTDYRHFNGNLTFISSFSESRFDLLDYYESSTNDSYFMATTSHSLGGFILNKIPLIRKLKLSEVVSARYLNTTGMGNYFEIGIGVEKLGIFRIDFVSSINDDGKISTGVVLGIKGILGP
jgi:uncharacterized protein DUF5686/carboxypeptidase-like protein